MTKGSSLALLLALITLDVRGFLQRHSISLAYVKDCTISRNEKLLGVENEQEEIVDYAAFVSKSKQARTKRKYKVDRTALRWVIESIHKQFNSEHESLAFPDLSSSLMSSLRQLYSAQTEPALSAAAQSLDSVLLRNVEASDQLSPQILERVLKVTSMMDLCHLSIPLFYWMLTRDDSIGKTSWIPSDIAYIALFNSLRRKAAIKEIRRAFDELIFYCRNSSVNITINTVAVNIVLATICDAAVNQTTHTNHRNAKSKGFKDIESTSTLSLLNNALQLLQPTECLKLDTRSFNTVLNAIAVIKDESIMNQVLRSMSSHGILPDTCTYNARLKLQMNQIKDEKNSDPKHWLLQPKITALLDEVLIHHLVDPDEYSIELMLIPMSKLNMWPEICKLLVQFNHRVRRKSSSYDIMQHSNAYAAFIWTLIESDEFATAERIFNSFLLDPSSKHALDCPKLTVHHVNIMMQGYILADSASDATIVGKTTNLLDKMISLNVPPDAYTYSILVGVQESSNEIYDLWIAASSSVQLNSILYRSFMQGFNKVHDVSSACLIFECLLQSDKSQEIFSINNWNVLLKCLQSTSADVPINFGTTQLFKEVRVKKSDQRLSIVNGDGIDHLLPNEAAQKIFRMATMLSDSKISYPLKFYPNSQTYCIMASACANRYCENADNVESALSLLHDAYRREIPGDGRFLNAVIRCFDNIDEAIKWWKSDIRMYALKHHISSLRACYHALCFVAGKSLRADVALRLVYAMKKDNIEPSETTLNCYISGKRSAKEKHEPLMGQYEAVLKIECCKYDYGDKRRKEDARLRIIF